MNITEGTGKLGKRGGAISDFDQFRTFVHIATMKY